MLQLSMDLDLNLIIPVALVVIGLVMILVELFIGIDSLFDLTLSGTALFLAGGFGIVTLSWVIALIVAILFLMLYWALGRSYIHKIIKTHPRKTNKDKLIGVTTKVSRVNDEKGKAFIKLEGEEWLVNAENQLKIGDKVEVTKVDGTILQVIVIN